jgi:hypothetical protein
MNKASYAVAIALTLASVYLSFRFMTHAGPLWRDEAATVQFATQPRYADVLASLDLVSLPPLYPTILRAWLSADWADQDAGVRTLGLVVCIAVLAAIWLGALALGTGPPLMLLALFAMHGTVVATLGAARPYGLGALAVLSASCALLRLVDSPRATVFAIAAALTTLAVQVQYQNVLFVAAAIGAGLAAAAWSRNVRSMLLVFMSGVIAALSLFPYLGILERSQQWRILHHSMAEGGPASVARRFVDFLTMDSVHLLGAWVVLAALACFYIARELRRRAAQRSSVQQTVFAAVLLVGAIGALLGFFLFVERDLQSWHVAPLIVLVALGLELIFAQPDFPAAMRLVIAVFVAVLCLPASLPQVTLRQTNVDFIAQRLGRDATAGDLIVANPWYLGITLERYYRGKATVITVPPVDDLRFHRIDQIRDRMVSAAPLQPIERSVANTLRGGGRVWVVGALHLPAARPEPLAPAPHPVSGWSEIAYTIGWSLQFGAFVRAHAQRVAREAVPLLKPVNEYENAQLFWIEGWVDARHQ